MRSLFFKIFLWFWLAGTLYWIAFLMAPARLLENPGIGFTRAAARDLLSLYAQSVESTMARGGVAAAVQHARDIERRTELQAHLLDPNGADVLGRPLATRPAQIAQKAFQTKRTEFAVSSRTATLATSVAGPDAQPYLFVGQVPLTSIGKGSWQPLSLTMRILLGTTASGIVCYVLARRLTRPVQKTRSAARRIATGDFNARVGPPVTKRRDEIGELARDFDFMAERVESLMSTQRNLLRDMSHELRSPLARLNMALGIVRQRTGPEAAGAIDRIERESDRLNDLIGQLLTLSRLEGGPGAMATEPVELSKLLAEVAADADFEARSRRLSPRIIHSEPCIIRGTPRLLRSAIENVVRNAVRYTPSDTQVELSLVCERRSGITEAVVRVRDRGPGVAPSELDNIFLPFHRVEDARDRQSGGVGLGLAISRRAVQAHKGSITASNAPDGGLVVEIRLPLSPDPPPNPP